jgi:hypothetical protein
VRQGRWRRRLPPNGSASRRCMSCQATWLALRLGWTCGWLMLTSTSGAGAPVAHTCCQHCSRKHGILQVGAGRHPPNFTACVPDHLLINSLPVHPCR